MEGKRARLEDLEQRLLEHQNSDSDIASHDGSGDDSDGGDHRSGSNDSGNDDGSDDDHANGDNNVEESASDEYVNNSEDDDNGANNDEDDRDDDHDDGNDDDSDEDGNESDESDGDNNGHGNDSDSDESVADEDGINFDNEEEREAYIVDAVRKWARSAGLLSMRKLDQLLALLHVVHPFLPLSYKTLLETPINVEVMEVEGGQLWYKGVKNNLSDLDLEEYLRVFNKVEIDVNVDGLPLFKSSRLKFWPILGRLVGSKNDPFVIAIFGGKCDPEVNQFLSDFVVEVRGLQNAGLEFNGVAYNFNVRNYICDAPARAKIKCIVEH